MSSKWQSFPSTIRCESEADHEFLETRLPDYDRERGIECEIKISTWPNEHLSVGSLLITGVDLQPIYPQDYLVDGRWMATRIEMRGQWFSGERVRIQVTGPPLRDDERGARVRFAFLPAIG